MPQRPTLATLRRLAVGHSLFPAATLQGAIDRLGFVQADPIRSPARAQDLTLRHRVRNYRAGDLERRYAALGIEEDFFINYGFLPRPVHALMHPRSARSARPPGNKRERALLEYVRDRGEVHPRDVHAHFSHGTVTNYWGGSSNATTHLLDKLHYRGLLRVARREGGIRIYAARELAGIPADSENRLARLDALIDVVVNKYAPLPGASLTALIRRLRYGVPQWERELTSALRRSRERLAHARVDDEDWYWPAGERLREADGGDAVRLLAPFDPVVWDRRRFSRFWGWEYRFEAYTPAPKRQFGYYALPLLWRDLVIGWANVSVTNGALDARVGYIAGAANPDRSFRRELDTELDRMRAFLGIA